MRQPVFHFQEELLTDAPLEVLHTRLTEGLPCLKACPGLHPPEASGEALAFRWHHHVLGAVEEGTVRLEPHERGTHLRMDLRLRGWSAFLMVGLVRFRTDGLLERIVRSL